MNTPETILIIRAAQALHTNGQRTEETIRSVLRLGRALDSDIEIVAGWDGLIVFERGRPPAMPMQFAGASPANIAMNRIVAIGRVIEDVISGRSLPSDATRAVNAGAALPPSGDAVFAVACASGAAALAVSFGVGHVGAVALIFLSALAGGFVRRLSGRLGANAFAQAFLAAAIAGIVGGLAVRCQISSDLRLIAVCPCMVLVPGPHLLNGTFDLLSGRIPLGVCRLAFATLVLASICAGLLLALESQGVTLPAAPVGREISVWVVMIAGAVAAASYAVFFSLPPRLIVWPVATAVIVDAIRWSAITYLHASPAVGAGIASLAAGIMLVPVARSRHIPLAGIGFASVVSLMPGVLVFRMVAGFLALDFANDHAAVSLIESAIVDGVTAMLVVTSMAVGLTLPKQAFDMFARKRGAL